MAARPKEEIPFPIPTSIGDCVEALAREENMRKGAEEIAAGHKANEDLLKVAILGKLAEQKLDKGTFHGYSVGRSETVVPQVTDWDAFYAYIKRTNYFHLLERRPTAAGCRELFETKGKIPGVVPFTKVGLSFRKAT
jgi:hypothetical protein